MDFLITAGPTREPVDPVRFISNRSSGRMGYALAQAALDAGHRVTLISGPVSISPPPHAEFISVLTADDMADAVQSRINKGCDAFIMCAAVADFKPREYSPAKIKKHGGLPRIDLVPTRDILSTVTRPHNNFIVAGFAAESSDLAQNAQKKLRAKNCDFICANDITRMNTGFDAHENELTLFFRDGSRRDLPRASKLDLARVIIKICCDLAEKR